MRIMFLLFGISTLCASAVASEPSWPNGPDAEIPQGIYLLTNNTDLTYEKILFKGKTDIKTNGYDLKISIKDRLSIEGALRIFSFDETDIPPEGAGGGKGQDGATFNRGPKTEGRGEAQAGRAGGNGLQGAPGGPGEDGKDAGLILLSFGPSANASGVLSIANNGGPGGAGGEGGNGGNGGNGEQGGRGKSAIIGCDKGPGQGGRGGDGGPGGVGGVAGTGGAGGTVVLGPASSALADWLKTIKVEVAGGQFGRGGAGGQGGTPGLGGYGGRGSKGCEGRETERIGGDGNPGGAYTEQHDGETGKDGKIVVLD